MKKSTNSTLICCLVLLYLGVSLCLHAQVSEIERVKEIIQRSEILIQQQQWDRAVALLTQTLESYRINAGAKETRGLLNFSLGALYQKKAEQNKETRVEDLNRAVIYYNESQKCLPRNKHILEKLALAKKNIAKYYVEIGDILTETGRLEKALDSYEKGAELDPNHKDVNWKVLRGYRNLGQVSLTELSSFCDRLYAANKIDQAKYGYELVMELSTGSHSRRADQALLKWAELCALRGGISKSSLSVLPETNEWPSSALSELIEMVSNPEIRVYNLDWWNSSEQKKHVGAAVLMTIASGRAANKQLESSAYLLEQAYELAPDYLVYHNRRLRPVMPTLIALELANLYTRFHEKLDPSGDKMMRLERRLFDRKTWAYAEKDYESIFRLHSVLGMLYADRKQWTSDYSKAANGIYQLEHALAAATQLRKKYINNFKPLPIFYKLLGDGYKDLNEPSQAYKHYMGAAVGYLDIDNLYETEKALRSAANLAEMLEMPQIDTQEIFNQILKIRKNISQLKPEEYIPSSPKYRCIHNELESIALTPDTKNPFLKRQYFKILADLGDIADQAQNTSDAINFHTKALKFIAKEKILTSMEDYIRLEKIGKTITSHIQIEGEGKVVDLESNLEAKDPPMGKKGWWLPSSSDYSPPYQIISDVDLFLAGRIEDKKLTKPQLFEDIQNISIRDGKVTLYQKRDSTRNLQQTIDALKLVSGVLEVDYERKSPFPTKKRIKK